MVTKSCDLYIVVQDHLVGVFELVHVRQFPGHMIQANLVFEGPHSVFANLGDGDLMVTGKEPHLAFPNPVPDL